MATQPEFIHYTRKYNRDIPAATVENLLALLRFYGFEVDIQHSGNSDTTIVFINFKTNDDVCFLFWGVSDYFLDALYDNLATLFNIRLSGSLDSLKLKLYIQSLCNRHELPVKTLDFISLFDLNEFIVSEVAK